MTAAVNLSARAVLVVVVSAFRSMPLADGDKVALGRTVFVFRVGGAEDRTRTER